MLSKLFLIVLTIFFFNSCINIKLEEKHIFIPQYKWDYTFVPTFNFNIKDTINQFKIYIIVKHENNYEYQNLWINLGVKPNEDSINYFKTNVILNTNDKGWLSSGFSNIYENRFLWKKIKFKKIGLTTFSIQQIMRDNPLENIVSIGLRIEQ